MKIVAYLLLLVGVTILLSACMTPEQQQQMIDVINAQEARGVMTPEEAEIMRNGVRAMGGYGLVNALGNLASIAGAYFMVMVRRGPVPPEDRQAKVEAYKEYKQQRRVR